MKKLFVFGLALSITAIDASAQCQKKVTWTSEKTEFLDASGKVQDVKTQPTKIETTPSHITVITDDDTIEGDIKELTCAWKEPFKNGSTSFKSSWILQSKNLRLCLTRNNFSGQTALT